MLEDFESVSDHFGMLCIKGLNVKFRNLTSVEYQYNFFYWNGGKISISNFLKKKIENFDIKFLKKFEIILS